MKTFIHFLAVLLLVSGSLTAQTLDIRKKHYNIDRNGLALQGYDPVAYFTGNKAVHGNKSISFSYNGVTYLFANAANRDRFKTNPLQYEPQYGGWCAYAMGAKGEKVEIDPETFKITDGKLYVFYNRFFNNTLKDWNKDETHLKANADSHWQQTITH